MVDLDVQKIIKDNKLDGFVLSKGNYFMGETPLCGIDEVADMTGFKGDGGFLLILKSGKKYLFISPRDELQAKTETKGITILASSLSEFLKKNKNLKIGYDPLWHPAERLKTWKKYAQMVKVLRKQRPLTSKEINVPVSFAGKSSKDKIKTVIQKMESKYLLISNPMELAWVLNKKGDANPFAPVIPAFGLLSKTGKLEIFKDIDKLNQKLRTIKEPIEVDEESLSVGILENIKNPVVKISPIALEKWIKNKTELKHIRDIAKFEDKVIRKCLVSLKVGTTEKDIVLKLQKLRKAEKTYLSDSFQTIAAVGKNAAIIHYEVTKESNTKLKNNTMLLIDTGGQYHKGTTDITTTVFFGNRPTQRQKEMYTAILKGHIALAETVFPEGATLRRLDAIARTPLWKKGKDYPHGTSHSIGFFGDVHEGYGRFANTPLKEGMVLSNEPGYYEEGAFGIRIENMMEVVRKGKFLGFKLLTHTPLDPKLILEKELTPDEKIWLKDYPK